VFPLPQGFLHLSERLTDARRKRPGTRRRLHDLPGADKERVGDLFGRLTAAPYRRWTEIGDGTHMVVLEKNRWQVLNAVTAFLNEVVP
jgi:hypothetical protein